MKIKETAETITTDGFHYDLFYGGYISPEDFLEGKDLQSVESAIKIITDFEDALEKAGKIEIM